MVGSGSQYKCLCRFRIPAKATGTCVLIFLTSVLCIVDFIITKLFDLKFYFDGFNALVFCTYNTTRTLDSARECAIVDVPIRFALALVCRYWRMCTECGSIRRSSPVAQSSHAHHLHHNDLRSGSQNVGSKMGDRYSKTQKF